MPVSSKISLAAQSFNQNANVLKRTLDGLADDEWLRRPSDHSNHVLWIVGHIAWTRTRLLAKLGAEWSEPWMKLYERGAKCVDSPECPGAVEVLAGWNETCVRLNAALEAATDESLDAAQGPPSNDGKVCGYVNFLAFHETYHVGQAAYLRCWLGHAGVMG
jgi:hypothetical protein